MPEHVTHDGLVLVVERPAADAAPARAPLLFVHGIFVGAGSLAGAQRFLAGRGHASAAVQLRGRFGSRPVARLGATPIADYVRDVLDASAWAERAFGGPPVLVGHSMGGLLVQKALEAGVRAPAAVLVCPAPPRGILALTLRIARRMASYLPAMALSRSVSFRRHDAFALALNQVPAARRDAMYERDFVPDSGRALRELALGVPVDARRVRVPMLALTGGDDRFVPPGTVRRVAARYGATCLKYAAHGHVLLQEPGAERPLGDLATWIDAVASSGPPGTSARAGGTGVGAPSP